MQCRMLDGKAMGLGPLQWMSPLSHHAWGLTMCVRCNYTKLRNKTSLYIQNCCQSHIWCSPAVGYEMLCQFSADSLSPLLNFSSDSGNFLMDVAYACPSRFNTEFVWVKNALCAVPLLQVILLPVSFPCASADTLMPLEGNVTLSFSRRSSAHKICWGAPEENMTRGFFLESHTHEIHCRAEINLTQGLFLGAPYSRDIRKSSWGKPAPSFVSRISSRKSWNKVCSRTSMHIL
jgi:hypothetical protein